MSNLLSQASLVMIPSGYKEDVVYSQIPTSGAGDLSFTRASNGTRINSAGLVEVCPWNLVEYSEQFDNGAWTAVNCSIVANDAIAPNGTTTADKFTTTSTTTECEVRASNFSILSNVGIPFTTSVYAKKGTANFLRIRNLFSTVTVIERNGWFNLNTGTLGTIDAGQTGTITDVGNGWYRCTLTGLVGSGGNANLLDIGFTNADNTSFPTTSVYGYLWGAQLNIGSIAKPYFPTTDRLNVPRLTYQNGGGGCPSLLLEKQSTNVFTYSEQFDDASWVKFNSSISANTTTSPDGTSNADSLIENTGNTDHGFYKFAPTITTALGAVTISCFIKSNGRRVQIKNSYTTDASNFDLQNGVVIANVGSGVGEIQNIGNGWYRCILKTTANAAGNAGLTLSLLDNSNNMVYTGNGTSGVYIYGAQIEASSYPTSYIPTTSSSATRVADACSKTGTLTTNANWTLYAEFDYINPSNVLDATFTASSGRFVGFYNWYGAFRIIYNIGGGAGAGRVLKETNGKVKVALQNDGSDCIVFLNGVKLGGADTGGALPITGNLSDINFSFYAGTLYDSIKELDEFVVFNSKLTDAECISLTTL